MKSVAYFFFVGLFVLFFDTTLSAQFNEGNIYSADKIIDPSYGIKMYEKLNFQTGGDSVRNDKKGYSMQGWVEDKYVTGVLLHKGYYEDGHLKIYKNYYPNSTLERSFKVNDFKRCTMQLFYPDGKKKSEVSYYEGNPQIWTDYYPNGQIEYSEESTKSMDYLMYRRSYLEDGRPQEIFEITDVKKKLYSKKEYYEDGKLKAEGMMHFNPQVFDYQREGMWKVYDESGKEAVENYQHGERTTEGN